MNRIKWYIHPVTILVLSIVAVVLSFFLYIRWYMVISSRLEVFARHYSIMPERLNDPSSWLIILEMSMLLIVIIVGLALIFVYYQKTFNLFRLQESFINNITHELKTPIASIQLYLETFRLHELSRTEQIKYLNYMLIDTDRLSQHVDKILDITLLENKSTPLVLKNTDLVFFINDFILKSKHRFEKIDLSFKSNLESFIYPIEEQSFTSLIENLISNANKFTSKTKGTLQIEFKSQNGHTTLHFRDDGIGLNSSDIKKIFKKFFRSHFIKQTKNYKGTGLGLYMAFNIAKNHHIKLSAQSEGTNQGSTFTLLFASKPPKENTHEKNISH